MGALLLALKALGWLLAVLVILLLLLLLVPVTVQLEYAHEQFTARLRVLFYTRQLWPEPPPRAKKERPRRKKRAKAPVAAAAPTLPENAAPEKKEQTPPSTPPAARSTQQTGTAAAAPAPSPRPAPEPKKEPSVAGVPLRRILDLLPTVGAVGKRILAGLRVHAVRLYWPLQGEDAAETALRYGQFCAAWGNVTGLVQNLVRLQCDQVQPVADYLGEHTGEEHFSCKITARVFIMVAAAVYGLYRLRQLAETQSI